MLLKFELIPFLMASMAESIPIKAVNPVAIILMVINVRKRFDRNALNATLIFSIIKYMFRHAAQMLQAYCEAVRQWSLAQHHRERV